MSAWSPNSPTPVHPYRSRVCSPDEALAILPTPVSVMFVHPYHAEVAVIDAEKHLIRLFAAFEEVLEDNVKTLCRSLLCKKSYSK